MSDPRYRSSFGFIDLLFNMLIGFVFLFMLAFLLINPVAKKETIKPKAEYFIELEPGSYTIVFSYIGYKNLEKAVNRALQVDRTSTFNSSKTYTWDTVAEQFINSLVPMK